MKDGSVLQRPEEAPASRLRILGNLLLDGCYAALPAVPPAEGVKKRVLVVRLDAIGDFVLWLDAARALRELYPPERFHLALCANALWSELAESQCCFDEVIALDTARLNRNYAYRRSMWRRLRAGRWDLALNPTFSRHMPFDDAVIRTCGASVRIGCSGDLANQRGWERRISDRWYTRLIPGDPAPLMELERNAGFLRALGLSRFRAGLPRLQLPEAARRDLPSEAYCVVVPGASLPIKQWPVARFAELARRLRSEYGFRILVCGSAKERDLGCELVTRAGLGPEAVDLAVGETTLTRFAALIGGARLVLSNDSSAVHLAAALGSPAVCLAGGAHYGRFVPYRLESGAAGPLPSVVAHEMECFGCNLSCRFPTAGGGASCLEGIAVDEVWREVVRVLGGQRSDGSARESARVCEAAPERRGMDQP